MLTQENTGCFFPVDGSAYVSISIDNSERVNFMVRLDSQPAQLACNNSATAAASGPRLCSSQVQTSRTSRPSSSWTYPGHDLKQFQISSHYLSQDEEEAFPVNGHKNGADWTIFCSHVVFHRRCRRHLLPILIASPEAEQQKQCKPQHKPQQGHNYNIRMLEKQQLTAKTHHESHWVTLATSPLASTSNAVRISQEVKKSLRGNRNDKCEYKDRVDSEKDDAT